MELQRYGELATETDFRTLLDLLYTRIDAVSVECSQYFFYLSTLHSLKREFGQLNGVKDTVLKDYDAQSLQYTDCVNTHSVIARLEFELRALESRYFAACTDFVDYMRSYPPLPQTHTAADLQKLQELRVQCESEIYKQKLQIAECEAESDRTILEKTESLKSAICEAQQKVSNINFSKSLQTQRTLRQQIDADSKAARKFLDLLQ